MPRPQGAGSATPYEGEIEMGRRLDPSQLLHNLEVEHRLFSAPQSLTQMGSSILVPRAFVMSPRSITFFQPYWIFRKSATFAFASPSLPQTKMSWSPFARDMGLTCSTAFMVFSVFTIFAPGSSFCACSPSESVLQMKSEGGIPFAFNYCF